MPHAKTSRKQLFRAALNLANLTATQWAEQEGITPEHLSRVLNSHVESGSLNGKIDAFTRDTLAAHVAAQPAAVPA